MPQVIDLTQAVAKKTFHKKTPFRLGLFGTLVVSNLLWLALFGLAVFSLIGVTRFSAALSKSYLEEKWKTLQDRLAQRRELQERDLQIARLIASQNSATTDVLDWPVVSPKFWTLPMAGNAGFLNPPSRKP